MWDANVGTTTRMLDAAAGRGDAADRLRLDGQRVRQHPRPDRRRDVPARPRRRLPELVRRDEVRRPRGRGAADRGRRAGRDRDARPGHTVPATTPRPAPSSSRRCERHAAVHRRSPTSGSRRSTSTTRRPGSSPRSIAAGSAGRTSSPATASGSSTPSRSRPRSAARSCPRLRIPNGVLRAMAPFGRLIGQPNLREIVRVVGRRDLLGELASARRTSSASPRATRRRRSATRSRPPDYTRPDGPRAPDVPAARTRAAAPPIAAPETIAMGGSVTPLRRHPDWIKARMPSGENYHDLKGLLRGLNLNTVCEEAHCPNIGECWDQRTATIMILGDTCTRACGFCAVKTGRPTWFDDDEPRRVAEAVSAAGPRARRRHERRPRRPARRRRPDLRRDDPGDARDRAPGWASRS